MLWRAGCGKGFYLQASGVLDTWPEKMQVNTQKYSFWDTLDCAAGTGHSSCLIPVPFKDILGKEKDESRNCP